MGLQLTSFVYYQVPLLFFHEFYYMNCSSSLKAHEFLLYCVISVKKCIRFKLYYVE